MTPSPPSSLTGQTVAATAGPTSPEEAGLAVYHFAGRWFAVWEDLDAAVELPEEVRRQVLRIRESPDPQGGPGRYGFVFDEA